MSRGSSPAYGFQDFAMKWQQGAGISFIESTDAAAAALDGRTIHRDKYMTEESKVEQNSKLHLYTNGKNQID